VRGHVVDAFGRGVAGARATAEGYARVLPYVASRDAAQGCSGERGAFELGGLRPDVGHSLLIEAEGFATRCIELASSAGTLELGEVVLDAEGLVAGTLVDADGVPVEDAAVALVPLVPSVEGEPARVSAVDAGARVQGRAFEVRSNADGAFLIEGLPAARYRLEIERDGATLIEREVVVSGPQPAPFLDLVLPLGCALLTGEVRGADGPAARARVELSRGSFGTRVSCDALGRFRIAGLDPLAEYELVATWSTPDCPARAAIHAAGSGTVRLVADEP
jgi:hypothetical protein